MGWLEHILRSFFVTFGFFELFSNAYHLTKKSANNIASSAKRQHQEIPMDLPNGHFILKVIVMLIFGIIFFISGLVMFINKSFYYDLAFVVLISFGIYGLIQGMLYRKCIKSIMAGIVYTLPLILYIIIL